ncbi:UNKNOWN [Stylonychia lemnae]|uniref:Uncharacterized protein n=1 Tax=Stylonychia lemnae TaxID=5949 RepID=A0A078AZH4_STYLE|nr:UNKNOWN [Stylonychia lemnae]|eukprot:CDW87554.1 UNKNOWN [Stylonychia lemnae]
MNEGQNYQGENGVQLDQFSPQSHNLQAQRQNEQTPEEVYKQKIKLKFDQQASVHQKTRSLVSPSLNSATNHSNYGYNNDGLSINPTQVHTQHQTPANQTQSLRRKSPKKDFESIQDQYRQKIQQSTYTYDIQRLASIELDRSMKHIDSIRTENSQRQATSFQNQEHQSKQISDQSQLESIYERISKLRQNLMGNSRQDEQSRRSSGFRKTEERESIPEQFNQNSNLQISSYQRPGELVQSTAHFDQESGIKQRDHSNFQTFQDKNFISSNLGSPQMELNPQMSIQSRFHLDLTSTQQKENINPQTQNQSPLRYKPQTVQQYQQLSQPQSLLDIQNYHSSQQLSIQNIKMLQPNLQELIKETERKVQDGTERKYQDKIQDLEKRSAYLDRSLDLIDEMKQKFQLFENQQAQYSDLARKYQELQNQLNQQRLGASSQQNITFQRDQEDLQESQCFNVPRLNQQSTQDPYISQQEYSLVSPISLAQQNKQIINGSQQNTQIVKDLQLLKLADNAMKLNHVDSTLEPFTIDIDIDHRKQQEDRKMFNNLSEYQRLSLNSQSNYNNGFRSSKNRKSMNIQHRANNLSSFINPTKMDKSRSPSISCSLRNRKDRLSLGGGGIQNNNKENKAQKLNKSYGIMSQKSRHLPQKSFDFPKSNNMTLLKHNQNLQKQPDTMNQDIQIFQEQTFAQLHKEIDKLKKQKKMLRSQLKQVNQKYEEQSNQQLKCCCQELQNYYENKSSQQSFISEHWRTKTQELATKYYKSLQILRSDQEKLKANSEQEIQLLKSFQDQAMGEVCKRQSEIQIYYEKKLRTYEKENKKLNKRLVQARNQMGKQ